MSWRSRKGLVAAGWMLVICVGLLGTIAAWAIAPYPGYRYSLLDTAGAFIRAPFADRIVLGDSRVRNAVPTDDALFIGYNGATTRELERMASVLCSVSDAPLVFALGVNDSQPWAIDTQASLASVERVVEHCGPQRTYLMEIWAVEPDKETLGKFYDPDTIAKLSHDFAKLAEQTGAHWAPAPRLVGHTHDGVHFTPDVSRDYLAFLAALPRGR
ncbi:SGNH/GDSL hydrolase family protein [Erythrobacter sp.]|uniref:SGNH/GDSL hydrolase family protein n=1 Tax=Erythrobacter sp. TaxID=1042 RepID=UPI00311FE243